ncbi:Putative cytochrome P450 hydroxylase [Amycolatopsis camponoti]|uniref:Cytochrome P450 hydroxylase n=1 Tax=Amycolatopsis camponoti TaxID=2606593 RepID=A0A6I8M6T4_9PSEU|nr:cytochrome P450 [Amycolatopsis camponoti]VVJ23311.1 Putative cytochrome P450 hydroxylase [Amycolatopsis camponoti]
MADELVGAIEARGHGDLVTELAYPLPIAIICDLLGVPERYREDVHEWSLVIDSADDTDGSNVREATDVLERLVSEVVDAKRATPGTDLISDLVAQEAAGTLTADEVTSTAFLILIGGHETTVGLISTGALALLTHPDEAVRARTDRLQADVAFETVLRRLPTAQLAVPEEGLTWWPSPITRGLFHLPVRV